MKKIIASVLALFICLSFVSCGRMGVIELDSFLSDGGKSILEEANGAEMYRMTYTTVMFAQGSATVETVTVYDKTSGITYSEMTFNGNPYMSFFVKGSTVYYETINGKEQKIKGKLESIAGIQDFIDVNARLDAALLPLTLSATKLSSLRARAVYKSDSDGIYHYVFTLGDKYLAYAAKNTDGAFDQVFGESDPESLPVSVNDYEITYSLGGNGTLLLITDYNSFKIEEGESVYNYEACVTIEKYSGNKLAFDENEYSEPPAGEYIKK